MASDDQRADGGISKEDLFGTPEQAGEKQRTSARKRLHRMYDLYLRSPVTVAWNDWRARIGGLGLLFYLLMGTVGVMIVPQPQLNEGPVFLRAFQDMSIPLGTDNLGRGVLKYTVHATPAMLKMAAAGVMFAVGFGSLVGFVAGYKGGILDTSLMTMADIMITLPGLPLIIIITSVYPPQSEFVIGAILSINAWPGVARSLRSQILTLREEAFVEVARAMGMSTPQIISKELTPRVAPYLLVTGAGAARGVITASVALFFIGVLNPTGNPNWGLMMQQAYSNFTPIANPSLAGHWLIVPATALAGLTFSLVLFSQGMDRVFNPRLRARHAQTVPEEEAEEEGGLL